MAEKNNATCSICGGGYHVCHSCKDSMQLQPWKVHCCSVDCYKVFQVVRGFSTGVYTKEEFKSKLENIDLSNLENYRDHIKNLIKDALKEDSVKSVKKVVEKAESIVKAVEENVVVENIVNDNVGNKDVVETEKLENNEKNIAKTTYSRKRNYKVDVE